MTSIIFANQYLGACNVSKYFIRVGAQAESKNNKFRRLCNRRGRTPEITNLYPFSKFSTVKILKNYFAAGFSSAETESANPNMWRVNEKLGYNFTGAAEIRLLKYL